MNCKLLSSFNLIVILFLIAIIGGCKESIPGADEPGPPWVIFNNENSPLKDDKINSITIDGAQRVWFATNNGAYSFRSNSWGVIKDSIAFPIYSQQGIVYSSRVSSITQGMDGSLWYGLYGGGAVRYNQFSQTRVWQRYTQSSGLIYEYVLGVASEKLQLGEVWCVTAIGISRFTPSRSEPDKGTWQTYTSSNTPQLTSNNIRAVTVHPIDNSIWFGTYDGVLISYDGDRQWGNFPIPPPYAFPITSIAFDLSNDIWLGKWEGASSFSPETGIWTHYNSETMNNIFPQGSINAVTTDLHTTRWFGSNAGLIRLSDTTWTVFNRANSPLPNDTVNALSYDGRGNLWIGTMNGVAVFNENGTRL
ncbi:MAG TPA: two-component regulator propeller domain-containing protein [Bacteroidota bacterium]|nr:two-component regulator propeller domain-containing protein [Bacteroidota bacterium]